MCIFKRTSIPNESELQMTFTLTLIISDSRPPITGQGVHFIYFRVVQGSSRRLTKLTRVATTVASWIYSMMIKFSIIFLFLFKINCDNISRLRKFNAFQVTRPRQRTITHPDCEDDSSNPCDPGYKYRTSSGRCNNLHHPESGAMGQPQPRLMPSHYDDGISAPRLRGIYGDPLPSARHVSQVFRRSFYVKK